MTYDDKVPLSLKKTQQWFGSIIGRPIDEDSRICPITPSGNPIEEEAIEHIVPSPTLRPAQRIQIYNQQYWWRLLSTLHETFPFLMRLFGYYDFNRSIGFPYLTKYPPCDWSLSMLGKNLPQWVEEDYHANDKVLVLNASKIDWAYNYSFIAPQLTPITSDQIPSDEGVAALLTKKLTLQPSIHLFEMDCDIFPFRTEFLKHDPEYWVEHDFPKLNYNKKNYFFIVYRNLKNEISWNEISEGEYRLLGLFKKGTTIEKACHWLEKQDSALCEDALDSLHLWFQEWTMRGWLSLQALCHSR